MSSTPAEAAAGGSRRPPARGAGALRAAGLGTAEKAAFGLLLVAALFPASAPTAVGLVDPAAYSGPWGARPFAGLSLAELGMVAVGALLVLRRGSSLTLRSTLDRPLAAFAGVLVALQFVAWLRNGTALDYELLDLERVGLLFAGYLLVTRLRLDESHAKRAAYVTAAVLALAFLHLVVRYGLLGSTQFGTSTGREALLITEDSLLVVIPVLLIFGPAVDGLLRKRYLALVPALLVGVFVIELLSLRRGAIILVGLALLVRLIVARPRWFIGVGAVAVIALGAGLVLGPGRPLAGDLRYLADSALLQTKDASTSQRKAELESFARNVRGADDAVLGRGLGAVWNAEVLGPTDAAAFGSGETEYARAGWHVYGLDWLYKLGAAGTLAALALLAHTARLVRRRVAGMEDRSARSIVLSLAITAPILSLLLFTNARIAFFAGVAIGLVSLLLDVSPVPSRGERRGDGHRAR